MGSSDYKSIALAAATSLALFAAGRSACAATDFGPNVFTFDASTPTAAIQDRLNLIFASQHRNEFGTNRYCLLFRPGHYTNLDVNLGYYTEVCGLGQMPGDVVIVGDVHSEGRLRNHNATVNFWRSCGNITIVPTNNGTMTWAVSQGTALRRVHVAGRLNLANTGQGAYSSGGFMADSQVDSVVNSLSQQQWLSRNDALGAWTGGVWNMVFVGVVPSPAATWPAPPHTIIPNTPLIRERPYLCLDNSGDFVVQVPGLQTNAAGTTWSHGPAPVTSLPIGRFHVAQPGLDSSASINAALSSGLNLILTPGLYHLQDSIRVTRPDTVVLGLGYPTLVSTGGFPAMIVSDVDGVKVAGIIFDAGNVRSRSLLEVGPGMTSRDHSADPICLYDLCARVGGATIGTAGTCVVINAHNVVGDNFWLWRADHGAGANWTQNASDSGLVVNGDDVTIYGLFVEHFEQYQTLWNGNRGRVYFYQSELPYDAPTQKDWSHDGVNGYASYKVADTVASHQAYGLGIYGVFTRTSTSCFNAIETPTHSPQVNLQNMTTVCIVAQRGSSSQITHIINGTGKTVGPGRSTATLASSASASSVPVRMGQLRPED